MKKHSILILIFLFMIILSLKENNSTVYLEYKPTMELEKNILRVLELTIKEDDTYETFIKRLQLYQQKLVEIKMLYVLDCQQKLIGMPINSFCFHTPQMDFLLDLGKDNDILMKYLKLYMHENLSSIHNKDKIVVCQKIINHLNNK